MYPLQLRVLPIASGVQSRGRAGLTRASWQRRGNRLLQNALRNANPLLRASRLAIDPTPEDAGRSTQQA